MKEIIYLRFDKTEWLEKLRSGKLRMNCPIIWNDFHVKKSNVAIYDDMEAISDKTVKMIPGFDKVDFILDTGSGYKLVGEALEPEARATFMIYYEKAHKDRAYCLYRLEIEDGYIISKVDPRNKQFAYDSFTIIKSLDELVTRIKHFYPTYDIRYGCVHYSNTETGRRAFDKPSDYSYQNETRIILTDNSINDWNGDIYPPYDLDIGNIDDITSEIYDFNSLLVARSISDFMIKH